MCSITVLIVGEALHEMVECSYCMIASENACSKEILSHICKWYMYPNKPKGLNY